MGMFDYISVADKLPTNSEIDASGINLYNEPFQTKDLDNIMATYFIQGGKLYVEKYNRNEWVENADSWAGGYIDRAEPYQEEVKDYHGKINFYHIIDKDGFDHWVEYDAYFTYGKLDKIELVKYKKESNVQRKKDLEDLFEEMKKERNKWYNKYIFHTKVWRKLSTEKLIRFGYIFSVIFGVFFGGCIGYIVFCIMRDLGMPKPFSDFSCLLVIGLGMIVGGLEEHYYYNKLITQSIGENTKKKP